MMFTGRFVTGLSIRLVGEQYKMIPDRLIVESLMVKKDGNLLTKVYR
jgi:hypothetical protein